MEQRIDSIIPAGTDPAYVPGVTPARPDQAEEDAPDRAAEQEPGQDTGEAASEDDAAAKEASSDDVSADDVSAEQQGEEAAPTGKPTGKPADDDPGTGESAGDEPAGDEPTGDEPTGDESAVPDGPVFEASDYRAKITAGPSGIVLRLDQEEAEFGWDEVGAVAIDTPRLSRWFRVTVHTTNGRSYNGEVLASRMGLRKTWTAELDAVLDACFEDAG
ncbi:hypothetical protein [Streptomyces sp. Ru87]|uniref:hypothetical protein n=1 Tax=Streptomyces sp. Ru87 TaxID=2044307 RepID=UPI000BFA2468|nr:hypothetical protein [Streptomyces sp. Ru87]PGH47594.1 hypothetical protein CRI70_27600 [Streptomyces sp. Ru87]